MISSWVCFVAHRQVMDDGITLRNCNLHVHIIVCSHTPDLSLWFVYGFFCWFAAHSMVVWPTRAGLARLGVMSHNYMNVFLA